MKCVVFDADGTLCDVSHRLYHLSQATKNWTEFFAGMKDDLPIESIVKLAQIIHATSDVAVIIVTARPDDLDYRQVTVDWLSRMNVQYDCLYMRQSGDFRADHIVKAEILEKILDAGYEPILAIEDRPQVVDMWRSHGITTLQCAPDEPRRSRYAGQTLLHVLIGPSGAGKTTYREDHYKVSDIVSSDDIRVQLYGDHRSGHTPDELARTWRYVHNLLKARLDAGVFTVLDATNLKVRDRASVLKCVPDGIFIRYIVIDRPMDDKINDRGWRSEALVVKHDKTFRSQLKTILSGDNHPYVVVQDKRIKH